MTTTQLFRSSGVLLHPTSLPGPYGIGDLGPSARAWVDGLARAKQSWWQILPLNPPGYGDSPYQSFSAFAGNDLLISPDLLVQEGLLRPSDLEGVRLPEGSMDTERLVLFKTGLFTQAWGNFKAGAASFLRGPFEEFCRREAGWLDDYALFMALKEAREGASWLEWPKGLVLREPEEIKKARTELADAIGQHQFRQFLFSRQWAGLKHHARQRGVRLIGDLPIYVSGDSVDVWANPHLFFLDQNRRPKVVAGVPPDYFCATGQLWGNPLYDWEAVKKTGYAWWVARVRAALQLVDLIRLDHFRGFEAYWEVEAWRPTAQVGRWVKGPGPDFLQAMRRELGGLPFLAEDLGLITPEVRELRDQFHLPGMRVLHFAFEGSPDSPFLPHNYERNTVVYTGTHDNDTTRGWYQTCPPAERTFFKHYLGRDPGQEVVWDLIRLALASVADLAVIPLQDVLDLGSEARMNTPSKGTGNWRWRFTPGMLTDQVLDRLGYLTELYGRKPS